MCSITPYRCITPVHTNLDTRGRNCSISELTQVTSSHQQKTGVSIVTAEGDTVTLSSSSQVQGTYATYEAFRYTRRDLTGFQAERLSTGSLDFIQGPPAGIPL